MNDDIKTVVSKHLIELTESLNISPLEFHFAIVSYLVESLYACRSYFGNTKDLPDQAEVEQVLQSLINSNIYWFNRLVERYNPNIKMVLEGDNIKITQR